MHSGTSANDKDRPASTLLRMPDSQAGRPEAGLAMIMFYEVARERNAEARMGCAERAWQRARLREGCVRGARTVCERRGSYRSAMNGACEAGGNAMA
ncbi:hypothetical protein HDG35_000934 [Paraburkholderia sp. JPY681]|nr:hypothetical protein [Paraburkholderia atlantica]